MCKCEQGVPEMSTVSIIGSGRMAAAIAGLAAKGVPADAVVVKVFNTQRHRYSNGRSSRRPPVGHIPRRRRHASEGARLVTHSIKHTNFSIGLSFYD